MGTRLGFWRFPYISALTWKCALALKLFVAIYILACPENLVGQRLRFETVLRTFPWHVLHCALLSAGLAWQQETKQSAAVLKRRFMARTENHLVCSFPAVSSLFLSRAHTHTIQVAKQWGDPTFRLIHCLVICLIQKCLAAVLQTGHWHASKHSSCWRRSAAAACLAWSLFAIIKMDKPGVMQT